MLLTPPKATEADAAPAGDAAVVLDPFVRASRERIEPAFDRTHALGTSSVAVGPEDIPAFGFLRHIVLHVTLSGGAGGTAVLAPDAPWSILSSVELQDVAGNPLVGPLDGFALYLANKYGAYSNVTDPRQSPAHTALDANGNGSFILRIPVEIAGRDGLGALANQNAAQAYKVRYTVAPADQAFTTSPTTLPSVRVRAYVESWAQPSATGPTGKPQETAPPAHGTSQYWSRQVIGVAAGAQTLRLARVGNLLRTLIFVARTTAGARDTTMLPDPISMFWDGNTVENVSRALHRHRTAERYGFTAAEGAAGGLDAGVLVLDMTHDLDYKPGNELRDLYWRTSGATRLELQGAFAAAGTLTVLTNDVAPAGPAIYGE